MTQEEKELLIKDLCARLPYRVKCFVPIRNLTMELTGKRLNYFCFHKEEWGCDYRHELEVVLDPLNDARNECIIKPYLRPMSSMTEEEKKDFETIGWRVDELNDNFPWPISTLNIIEGVDWLNKHHFDYRGLIEKGLALEAPSDMYKEE